MKVCYFGTFDHLYTRNRINIKGLRENGVEVIECRTELKSKKKYFDLIKKHKAVKNNYDIMVVGFAGHAIMPLAWLLARLNKKKLVIDMFVSEYDSVIFDRKAHSKYSFWGLKYYFMDWLASFLPDRVLLETNAHIDYFVKTFKISKKKFRRLEIGCDEEIFYPRDIKREGGDFIVHFHGSYAPVQGVEYIIKAAEELREEAIKFNIIGKLGNYHKEIDYCQKHNLDKVNFIDLLSYEQLAEQMAGSDICLGMFGHVNKSYMTAAFKVIEAMAIKKPVITADTPAMREFFVDRENILFCKGAEGKDLAVKILELKNNQDLANKIADNGYQLFKNQITSKKIGETFKNILAELI